MPHIQKVAFVLVASLACLGSCKPKHEDTSSVEKTTKSHERKITPDPVASVSRTPDAIVAQAKIGQDNQAYYKSEVEKLSSDELKGMIETLRSATGKSTEEDRLHFFLLDEIAKREPLAAIELIKGGLNCNIFGVSENMFKQILLNPTGADLAPAIEQIAKNVGKEGRSVETASALVEALASTGGSASDYRSSLKLLFAGKNAPTFVSLYFGESNSQSPEALLKVVETLNLTGREKGEAVSAIAFGNIRKNPELSLSLLNQLDPQQAGSTYGSLFASWLSSDPAKATSSLETMSASQLQVALRSNSLINALTTRSKPEVIAGLLGKIPLTASTSQTFSRLLGTLAEKSPADALRIITDLPESSGRDNLIRETMQKADVQTAADASGKLSDVPDSMKSSAARGLLIKLAGVDQEAALEFIGSIPKNQQSKLTAELISQVNAKSPEQAAELLEKQYKKGTLTSDDASVASNISQAMANHSLEQTKSWSQNLPVELRPGAYRGLMTVWSRTNAVEASEWLGTLPAGPARDAGARALIQEIEATDTATADKWRETLAK